MGRHSRKGSAPSVADTGQQAAVPRPQPAAGAPGAQPGRPPQGGTGRRRRTAAGAGQDPKGTPAHGTPVYGTPAHGTPAYGTPAHGTPVHGTPAHGTPAYGGGAHDTGAHAALGTPAHGVPVYGGSVRGGHPQHEEGAAPRPYGARRGAPRTGEAEQGAAQAPFIPGPRRETLPEADEPAGRGGLGRTLTGVAAAAVATVLAVVVTGQVADKDEAQGAASAAGQPDERASDDTSASRSDDRTTPSAPSAQATPPPPPTYEQLIARQYPIDPKLKGSGKFGAVPGFQKAPGKGNLVRYRIDVEEGLGLDQNLFATTVFKTLNDRRSWAGNGEMTFERISSGEPQFVITLASPGTTGVWCAKSGLDTLAENVSCDSAQTDRVMINAYRWAQGSETFGPKAMFAYRQMLINHEVGHRLGHGHVNCGTPGALAPVMQQQTKSLDIGGIKCRPNPWVHPGS
ncbi:hypothetical protein AMK27_23765 [Streptomyces sp. CB02009]|uniref:DUF3152 domain-containing protein n=1 Tax=Streptomyces sp. CB02009 TaxID=1703938 RepID=UPI00093EFC72|nr:DUF3152 domain-containing protein [Streptomyces sp. CB02009]OKJ56744.1 hypothetical protein AMK27_23765 [Streptomyces sp. CB02009]